MNGFWWRVRSGNGSTRNVRKPGRQGSGGDDSKPKKQVISLISDVDLIYTAFVEQFGINLAEKYLDKDFSWLEYLALMGVLNSKTFYGKIIYARSLTFADKKNMSKEQKNYYGKLKTEYPYIDDFGQQEAINKSNSDAAWKAVGNAKNSNIKEL